jgi:hypothetical protein
MFTLRCTQRLLKTIPFQQSHPAALATTALGDWYANTLVLRRMPHVMCTSDRSLLTVIVPAGDLARLPLRLCTAVASLLSRLGCEPRRIAAEIAAMNQVVFARTVSRSVLASMNDFADLARTYTGSRTSPRTVVAIEERLAQTPRKPLRYAFPIEVAAALLGAA